jgi:hypothetical protein
MKFVTSTMLVLMVAATSAVASPFNDIDLEPALNGGVSASGLFPTQDLEDRYGSAIASPFNDIDLEPALNGGVSASGLFPTQDLEDRYDPAVAVVWYNERDLEPAFNGGVSASGLFPTQEAEDRASEETKSMLSEMSRNR